MNYEKLIESINERKIAKDDIKTLQTKIKDLCYNIDNYKYYFFTDFVKWNMMCYAFNKCIDRCDITGSNLETYFGEYLGESID